MENVSLTTTELETLIKALNDYLKIVRIVSDDGAGEWTKEGLSGLEAIANKLAA